MNSEQFGQLLIKLNASDNEIRKGGEAELQQLWDSQPANVLLGLANMMELHPDSMVSNLIVS